MQHYERYSAWTLPERTALNGKTAVKSGGVGNGGPSMPVSSHRARSTPAAHPLCPQRARADLSKLINVRKRPCGDALISQPHLRAKTGLHPTLEAALRGRTSKSLYSAVPRSRPLSRVLWRKALVEQGEFTAIPAPAPAPAGAGVSVSHLSVPVPA